MKISLKNLGTLARTLALLSCSIVAYAQPSTHHPLSAETNITIPLSKPADVPDALRTLSSPLNAPINVAISPEMLSDPSQKQALEQVITKAAEQGSSVNILVPPDSVNVFAYTEELASLQSALALQDVNAQIKVNNYMELNTQEELQNQITELNNYIATKNQQHKKSNITTTLGWVAHTALIAVDVTLIATSQFSDLAHTAALAGITTVAIVVTSPSVLDPSQKKTLYSQLQQIAAANGITLSSIEFTVNPSS